MIILRPDDAKWINNVGVYFEILKELNNNLYELIDTQPNYNSKIEVLFLNITYNINKLFPIRRNKLDFSDGILSLKEYILFLKSDYQIIFKDCKNDLLLINDMRNKYEHLPHTIKWKEYIGDDKYKKMIFINDAYNEDIIENNIKSIEERKKRKEHLEWIIDTDILINIVKLLNGTFVKIQKMLIDYFNGNEEALDHPYIKGIITINIDNYNKKIDKLIINRDKKYKG